MDFYNNVAAIAAVLMFAKLVTHRTREVPTRHVPEGLLTIAHFVGVIAAAAAILVSLIATAYGNRSLQFWAGLFLGASGLILVVDVLAADWSYAKQRQENAQHPGS